MRVIKINNIHRNADIVLDDENKRLSFVFGGNGDLYWIIKK